MAPVAETALRLGRRRWLQTELPQMMIRVAICPTVPILGRHRAESFMTGAEGAGRCRRKPAQSVDRPAAIGVEIAWLGSTGLGINARGSLQTSWPGQWNIQSKPLEQTTALGVRRRRRVDYARRRVAQVAQHFTRGHRAPLARRIGANGRKPHNELSQDLRIGNALHGNLPAKVPAVSYFTCLARTGHTCSATN